MLTVEGGDGMEELTQREKLLFERLPLAAMQLRTALGGIYFGARRLATPEERENDPELDRNAAVLYRSYYQLLRLAKDLESVELLGREEPLPRENLDLLVWLDEIIRECQVPFELKGVTLELLCSERYVITAVNKRWLEQAVWHLLSNALAACGKGGRVTVTLLAQRTHVLIKVADNGRGIPPEQQDMLRTWHLRPVTPEYLTGGLGIGLPVVHQVMKLHGGQMLLDSKEGAGTTVTLALPAERTSAVLHEPTIEYHGGFQRALVELAGALPAEAYLIKQLDQ